MTTVVNGYVVHVVVMDMVVGIRESVHPNPDGSYTIFLNARYNCDTQQRAYLHAIEHIKNHDWEKDSVQDIEAAAHGLADREDSQISKRLEEFIKRHAKGKAARKRKLDRYAKKYAGMTPAEIEEHNQRMIDRRDM